MILSAASAMHDTVTHDCIRKFMNGAVYIESCLTSNQVVLKNSIKKDLCRKRISCSCSSDQLCKTHENLLLCKTSTDSLDNTSSVSDVSISDENGSKQELSINGSVTKESRSSILSLSNPMFDMHDYDKEAHFKNWMSKKMEEKRRISESQVLLQQKQEKEKQIRLEQERENFKRWLANKKKEQEQKEQKEKKKTVNQESVKEEQKKLRAKEAELKFKLWCKRKEEKELERKLREKMEEIKTSEDKERRLEENRIAYKNWLKTSVNKPTPIPLGKGLETLRASMSVTYVNPIPWQPNIDTKKINLL